MHLRVCSRPQVLSCIEAGSGIASRYAGQPRQAPLRRSRSFSTSTPVSKSSNAAQRRMRQWFRHVAKDLKNPPSGRTSYITGLDDQPFPKNAAFTSQPVLSESSRTLLWTDIMVKGAGLKEVSAKYNVDIRRVAAVVRLKELEKSWEAEGKPLAKPYAHAILGMLPRTELTSTSERQQKHEHINEIHVHSYTMQQLFLPTSESRHFTRQDAARAMGDHILPADKVVRIPELITYEKKVAEGVSHEQAFEEFKQEAAKSEQKIAAKQAEKVRNAEQSKIRVQGPRWEYRFTQFNSEAVGARGRARNAIGWKYGVPHADRRKGLSKIPLQVGPKTMSDLV